MTDVKSYNRKFGLFFFVLCYLAYSSIYVARLNFSVASVLLETAGTLTKAQIGIIGSIFSLTYAAAKLPAGYLGDRLPSALLIGGGLLLAAAANAAIGIRATFASICIFWFLNACGQAILWGPLLRTLHEIYGPERGARLGRLISSSVAVGSIAGLYIASDISAPLGAAMCFLIPAAVTGLMGAAVLLFLPREEKRPYRRNAVGRDGNLFRPAELLRDRQFLLMAGPTVFHGIIKDNINVWIAVYFVNCFDIDVYAVAGYVFLAPLLGLAGRLLFPMLAEVRKARERQITVIGFLTMAAAIVLLMTSSAPVTAVIAFGVVSAAVSMINVYLLASFPVRYAERGGLSFVASLMDVVTYTGAGIGSLCFGFMISEWGFNSMFLVWLLGSLLSVFLLRMVKE